MSTIINCGMLMANLLILPESIVMKMRIYRVLILLLFCMSPLKTAFFAGHTDATGKTFLQNIVPFQNSSPERMSFFDTVPDMSNWHLETILFGGASTNDKQLARYFLPYGDSFLVVTSGKDFYLNSNSGVKRDVDSTNFNLFSQSSTIDYRGTVEIHPEEKYWGIGIFASKGLLWKDDETVKFRVQVAIPIMEITHKTGLYENIIQPVNTTYYPTMEDTKSILTMTEALNQPKMLYGKIAPSNATMKRGGVADIELSAVYTSTFNEHCITESFGGLVIPTGNRPGDLKNKWGGYMWEPVIGNGDHWGLEYGNNIVVTITENDERRLAGIFSLTTTYLFPNYQMRTFDLKGKEWGRYLAMWPNQETMLSAENPTYQGSFGTNSLTLYSLVSPRFSFLSTSFLNYEQEYFTGSIGYTVIGRQAEHIDISQDLPLMAIKGASSAPGAPTVSIARDIAYQFTCCDLPPVAPGTQKNNFALAQISQGEIDPNSAAQPAVLAGALSACIGYQHEWDDGKHGVIGIAGSYRFASNNALPEGWMTWITGHIDF